MFEKITGFAEQHPQVIAFAATFIMLCAIEMNHQVMNWADGLKQIRASESLGG